MYYHTSESVSEGHPDKIADQIADAVLDACLQTDSESRVGCEVFGGNGFILVGGEISTHTYIDIQSITRLLLQNIGYTHHSTGIDSNTIAILSSINEQSKDIAQGVNRSSRKEQGAGDQGIIYGYACRETPEYMPAPIQYAHKLMIMAKEMRKTKKLPYLLPDGKCQITIGYENREPKTISSIVFSHQHQEDIDNAQLAEDIKQHIIYPTLESTGLLENNTQYLINPTGRFVKGGFQADTGLTGRKIIVDTYGGICKHGGGAFSGKDPSKVDRSAAYMARRIAKTVVASQLADICEVQLAYAIGVAEPVNVDIQCFSTENAPLEKIRQAVLKTFDCTPAGITDTLHLLDSSKVQYTKTAVFGHFGRTEFTWEQIDKQQILSLQNSVS